jgi:ribosomal protein L24
LVRHEKNIFPKIIKIRVIYLLLWLPTAIGIKNFDVPFRWMGCRPEAETGFSFEMEHIDGSRYCVVTFELMANKDLLPNEKILLSLISGLSKQKGYCFASNKYLAYLTSVSERMVQKYIASLEKSGWLGRVIEVDKKTKQVKVRALYVNEKKSTPPEPQFTTPRTTVHEVMNHSSPYIIDYSKDYKENTDTHTLAPSLVEVIDAFQNLGYTDKQAEKFYNKYTAIGWVDKNKIPIVNWLAYAKASWIPRIKAIDKQNEVKDKNPQGVQKSGLVM